MLCYSHVIWTHAPIRTSFLVSAHICTRYNFLTRPTCSTQVMCAAIEHDNSKVEGETRLVQLEAENNALRELLGIAGIPTCEEYRDEEEEQ